MSIIVLLFIKCMCWKPVAGSIDLTPSYSYEFQPIDSSETYQDSIKMEQINQAKPEEFLTSVKADDGMIYGLINPTFGFRSKTTGLITTESATTISASSFNQQDAEVKCPDDAVITGIQAAGQTEITTEDDRGITNLKILCSDIKTGRSHGWQQLFDRTGTSISDDWSQYQAAKDNMGICAIEVKRQTVDDPNDPGGDNRGIIALKFYFCMICFGLDSEPCYPDNYDKFKLASAGTGQKMTPPVIWGGSTRISCMDIASAHGDVVIGGYSTSVTTASSPLFMAYYDSTIDFTAESLNSTFTWALGMGPGSYRYMFDNCKFSPQAVPPLGHKVIVGTILYTTHSQDEELFVVDPLSSESSKYKLELLVKLPTKTTLKEGINFAQQTRSIEILQDYGKIMVYYLSHESAQKFNMMKCEIDTYDYSLWNFKCGQSVVQATGMTTTNNIFARKSMYVASEEAYYFAYAAELDNSAGMLVILRTKDPSYLFSVEKGNIGNVPASMTDIGTTWYKYSYSKFTDANNVALKIWKTMELMDYYNKMIGVSTMRHGESSALYSSYSGIPEMDIFTWCDSGIKSSNLKFYSNQYLMPLILRAQSNELVYIVYALNMPMVATKLQVLKFIDPVNANCISQAGTIEAFVADLDLDASQAYDHLLVDMAFFDTNFGLYFFGGKTSRTRYSAQAPAGFLTGFDDAYIGSLDFTQHSSLTSATANFQQMTSGFGVTHTFDSYTNTASSEAVFSATATDFKTNILTAHNCHGTVSTKVSSTFVAGYIWQVEHWPSLPDRFSSFSISELFQTADPTNCPLNYCQALTYRPNSELYGSTFENRLCDTTHSSNITFGVENEDFVAKITTTGAAIDYKVCLFCGTSASRVLSPVVFGIKATVPPCAVISITFDTTGLPHSLQATRTVFKTLDGVREEPNGGQTAVTKDLGASLISVSDSQCPLVSHNISKVLESDGTTEIAKEEWSQIISLEGMVITVLPIAAQTTAFSSIQIFIGAYTEMVKKEEHVVTLNVLEEIEDEVNKPPYFTEDLDSKIVLEFEYYPVGPKPGTKSEPEKDETMEITPPTKQVYSDKIYELPAIGDVNGDTSTIEVSIPSSVADQVSYNAEEKHIEIKISEFTFAQVNEIEEFEISYTLTDHRGLGQTLTQIVELDVTLVYETRTFTQVKVKRPTLEEMLAKIEQEQALLKAQQEEASKQEQQEKEEAEAKPVSATGLVFPGLAIPFEMVPIWEGEDGNPPVFKKEKEYLPLRASISDITTLGLLTLQFNQPIQGEVFTLEDINDEVLFFEMVPGEYELPSNFDITRLNFVWETVEFDSAANQLKFQVDFTDAMYISANIVQDEIGIRVINPDLFKSTEFDRRLSYGSRNMWSPVKKQMPNTDATRAFDSGTTATRESMSAATLVTFGLNLVFSGAMKEMMGTILSLQVVINLFLFTIPFPANSSNFISKLKPIVSFNIVKTITTRTIQYFPLDEDKQAKYSEEILPSVRDLGTKTHNALPNLGNLFHLLAFYFWRVLFLTYYKFRGIGNLSWGGKYLAVKNQLFFGGLLNILISGFIPIAISVYFQMRHPLFTTWGEIIGFSFGAVFFLLEFVFFPVALVWILFVPQDRLDQPDFKQRWGLLYTKARYDTWGRKTYLHVFILRRLLVLLIGLELYREPPFQLVAINIMNVLVIIYVGLTEPQKTAHDRMMELFNEGMVALITYNMFMFTDALPDQGAQYVIGWAFVASLAAMLFGNSYFVVKGMLRRVYLLLLKKHLQYEHQRKLAQSNYDAQLAELREAQAQKRDLSLASKQTLLKDQLMKRKKESQRKKAAKSKEAAPSKPPKQAKTPRNLPIILEETEFITEADEDVVDLYLSVYNVRKPKAKPSPSSFKKKKPNRQKEERIQISYDFHLDLHEVQTEAQTVRTAAPSQTISLQVPSVEESRPRRQTSGLSMSKINEILHPEPVSELDDYLSSKMKHYHEKAGK